MQRDTLVDPFEIAPPVNARAQHPSRQRTQFDAPKPPQQTLVDPFERSSQHTALASLKYALKALFTRP